MKAPIDSARGGVRNNHHFSRHSRFYRSALVLGAGLLVAAGQPEEAILGEAEEKIIRYSVASDWSDPVTRFQKRLEKREAKLQFEPQHGYLTSLLQQLGVRVSLQTLVFSKTSSQAAHTNP
ncbi:MAG: hypothetical protein EXS36_04135 [Pedosphaera sp.]|nr:hypothetical protein [Pedosphaera sp.]